MDTLPAVLTIWILGSFLFLQLLDPPTDRHNALAVATLIAVLWPVLAVFLVGLHLLDTIFNIDTKEP